MLVCIAVFRTPVSLLGGVGSAIAIAGSYAYAAAKTAEKLQAGAAAAAERAAGEGEGAGEAAGAAPSTMDPRPTLKHLLFLLLFSFSLTLFAVFCCSRLWPAGGRAST